MERTATVKTTTTSQTDDACSAPSTRSGMDSAVSAHVGPICTTATVLPALQMEGGMETNVSAPLVISLLMVLVLGAVPILSTTATAVFATGDSTRHLLAVLSATQPAVLAQAPQLTSALAALTLLTA